MNAVVKYATRQLPTKSEIVRDKPAGEHRGRCAAIAINGSRTQLAHSGAVDAIHRDRNRPNSRDL
jgi:hypothetical protein